MLDTIKKRLWRTLEKKAVSLAMVFDAEGRILWHKGRPVRGRDVREAEGFSRSLILESLERESLVSGDEVLVSSAGELLPRSARLLHLKTVLVQPLGDGLYLYVDSGTREAFDDADRKVLALIGDLLTEGLADIRALSGRTGGVSGTSEAVATIRARVAKYALEEEPVLLTGETGVGKSRVAELLHRASGRRGGLVAVHTPSIPEGLLESELFGHRKGAYTGAVEDRRGLVEEAQGGTLFLDEIGEIPAAFQAKLLRFVETHKYRSVGDPREREADIRLVTATNRDLEVEVKARRFREDLFYRLSVLRLHIPPLRERVVDIEALVAENARSLRGHVLSEEAWKVLRAHSWPGNVRELIHVLTRAGVDLEGPTLGREISAIVSSRVLSPVPETDGEALLAEAAREIASGRSFWDTVWERFLERDLSRKDVRAFLVLRFADAGHSLKRLAAGLNIEEEDYGRFVSSLHKYAVHPGR